MNRLLKHVNDFLQGPPARASRCDRNESEARWCCIKTGVAGGSAYFGGTCFVNCCESSNGLVYRLSGSRILWLRQKWLLSTFLEATCRLLIRTESYKCSSNCVIINSGSSNRWSYKSGHVKVLSTAGASSRSLLPCSRTQKSSVVIYDQVYLLDSGGFGP